MIGSRASAEVFRARQIGGGEAISGRSRERSGASKAASGPAEGGLCSLYFSNVATAGLAPEAAIRLLTIAAIATAAALIGAFISFFTLLLVPLPWILIALYLKARQYKRAEEFERDYPALLISLASSVRSGIDPSVALSEAGKLFLPLSEVSKAITTFKNDLEEGRPEEDAIGRFACEVRHPDIDLFRSALLISRKHGSSLGHCLHRLTKVTRARQSFRRKIRAAVAMQKLSAIGIAVSACAIGVIQYLSSPKAINLALQHPVGFKLMMMGIFLILFGIGWMMFMARSRI
ncbi:MAG: type II secretion system F family protein [Deltaproteobacteria bacterium]|nr:type II secretion system F family protein [Deltaproteobacteria bacterium]